MLLPVKFKLKPNPQQRSEAESWRPMIRAFTNFCLSDRIDAYAQSFACGPFCDLKSKAEHVRLAGRRLWVSLGRVSASPNATAKSMGS